MGFRLQTLGSKFLWPLGSLETQEVIEGLQGKRLCNSQYSRPMVMLELQ